MGGIFGGGGRLLDISEDGKTTFADTWLGDLLGFDGSLGVNGPNLKESWGGARRTFEDAARGYVTSKLTQKKAEDQFDITGIDQYRPMLPPRETTPSSVPTDTEAAMTYGPQNGRGGKRRKPQTAEESLMQRPVTNKDGGPLYSEEEMMELRSKVKLDIIARMRKAQEAGDSKLAEELHAQLTEMENEVDNYFRRLVARGKEILTGQQPARLETTKPKSSEYLSVIRSKAVMSLPENIRGDVQRAIRNNDLSSVVSIIEQAGFGHVLGSIREQMELTAAVADMKEKWGAYD